jgi:serine/threonine protein phosphatase 1
MAGRTIAIGDIHGCHTAFAALLAAVEVRPEDTLVTLGDYIDRGPDSRQVIDRMIRLGDECRLKPLLGNHEEMMLGCRESPAAWNSWSMYGGRATMLSYGAEATFDDIPAEHLAFLEGLLPYHETDTHLFLHANYVPELPLARQNVFALRWESLRGHAPGPHVSGKTAIVGHTSQPGGQILDLGHLVCIDTHCYGGGWLTALDVDSGQLWQANQAGQVRTGQRRGAEDPAG